MSDKPISKGQQAVDAYLAGLTARNELIPGAREYLAKRFACSNPHGGIRALIGCIEHGDGRRFWNPEKEPTGEAPLRKLIRRFTPALNSAKSADDVYDSVAMRWTPEDLEHRPEQVAEQLWDLLYTSFEHRNKFREPPPLDRRTARVREALDRVAHHLKPHLDLDRLAHDWKHLGDMTPEEVARAVATRLGTAQHAADLTRDGRPVRIPFREFADADADAAAPATPLDLRAEFARLGGYEGF
jgi:hypothetical protein